jgi:hypothetical protein
MSTGSTPATGHFGFVRRSQLTVQGWQNLVLGVMGVLVLAGAVAGAMLLTSTDDVTRDSARTFSPPASRHTSCRQHCATRKPRYAGT